MVTMDEYKRWRHEEKEEKNVFEYTDMKSKQLRQGGKKESSKKAVRGKAVHKIRFYVCVREAKRIEME